MGNALIEDPLIRANEAKHVLEHPLFVEAFEAVGGYLESRALSCEPDNKDMAQRVILAKQILVSIRREFERVINDGAAEKVRIAQIEKSRTLKQRVFQR